jgi:hypothetical protein
MGTSENKIAIEKDYHEKNSTVDSSFGKSSINWPTTG